MDETDCRMCSEPADSECDNCGWPLCEGCGTGLDEEEAAALGPMEYNHVCEWCEKEAYDLVEEE